MIPCFCNLYSTSRLEHFSRIPPRLASFFELHPNCLKGMGDGMIMGSPTYSDYGLEITPIVLLSLYAVTSIFHLTSACTQCKSPCPQVPFVFCAYELGGGYAFLSA